MSNSNWDILPLQEKEICSEIRSGYACGTKNIENGVPHLRMNNISVNGNLNYTLVRRIPNEIAEKKNLWLKPMDVLFCNTNSTALVGKTCLFSGWEEQCTYSNHLTRIRCNKKKLLPKWLALYLKHLWHNQYFAINCKEFVGQSSFSKDKLKTVKIPVPPLDEQCRIVTRIEKLTCRLEEVQKSAYDREENLDLSLKALYCRIIVGTEWKPLKEVASLVRRKIETKPKEVYEEMGIRSFGKGTFKKPELTGEQIGNKRIYRIHKGDLVFNNVFAWEKAVAVAKEEDHGRVGSHRFITYVPHKGKSTPEFLCHHFLSEKGIEDIRAASPGSAGRNRTLGLKKLEKILVPFPDHAEQIRFSEIEKRRQAVQIETTQIEYDIERFNAALLAKAFRGEL